MACDTRGRHACRQRDRLADDAVVPLDVEEDAVEDHEARGQAETSESGGIADPPPPRPSNTPAQPPPAPQPPANARDANRIGGAHTRRPPPSTAHRHNPEPPQPPPLKTRFKKNSLVTRLSGRRGGAGRGQVGAGGGGRGGEGQASPKSERRESREREGEEGRRKSERGGSWEASEKSFKTRHKNKTASSRKAF